MFGRLSRNSPQGPLPTPVLATPGLNSYGNPRLETSEKAVRQWLNNLPILNPAHAVPAVLDRLVEINCEPLAFRQRLRLLELYREPVNRLFFSFDEAGLHRLPISREERNRIKTRVGELCVECSVSFKILVKQGLQEGMHPARDDELRRALLLAVEQLAHCLLHAYRSYGPIPAFVLLELNQLYQLADAAGVLPPPPSRLGRRSEPGIGSTYLTIILLAALDPYHMEQCQCMQLHQTIGPLASLARIQPWEPDSRPEDGVLLLDLNADSAPRAPRANVRIDEDADPRRLDTRPVRDEAERLLTDGVAETAGMPRAQLTALGESLRAGRERGAARHKSTEQVYVATSLPACLYFLRNQHMLADAETDEESGMVVRALQEVEEETHTLEKWRVENESIRGLLLARQRNDNDGLRVGDAVTIAATEGSRNRAPVILGMIRWLRSGNHGDIQVGVETLPGLPRAVMWKKPGGGAERLPAILLPPVAPLKLPYRFITAPDTLSGVRNVELALGSDTLRASIGEAGPQTGDFHQVSLIPR